jgi:hypothetical protein
MIDKTILRRITAWMADYEDSSLLEESVQLLPGKTIKDFLLAEAMDIFHIVGTKGARDKL